MKIEKLFSLSPLAEGADSNRENVPILHSNMKYWKNQLEYFWLTMERPLDFVSSFFGIKMVASFKERSKRQLNSDGKLNRPEQLNSERKLNSPEQLNTEEKLNSPEQLNSVEESTNTTRDDKMITNI